MHIAWFMGQSYSCRADWSNSKNTEYHIAAIKSIEKLWKSVHLQITKRHLQWLVLSRYVNKYVLILRS